MPRCSGTTHGTWRPERAGQPCEAWAVKGATVCVVHGGAAPQVKAKAAARLVETSARKLLDRFDPKPVTDPLTALQALAGRQLAFVEVLEGEIAKLQDAAVTSETGVEHAHAVIVLYQKACDDTRKTLRDNASLNIDERLARVSEMKADVAIRVLVGALTRAGFDPDHALIAGAVEAELVELEAAPVRPAA